MVKCETCWFFVAPKNIFKCNDCDADICICCGLNKKYIDKTARSFLIHDDGEPFIALCKECYVMEKYRNYDEDYTDVILFNRLNGIYI